MCLRGQLVCVVLPMVSAAPSSWGGLQLANPRNLFPPQLGGPAAERQAPALGHKI